MNNMQHISSPVSSRLAKMKSLGEILLDAHIISAHDVERILHCQQQNDLRFGEAALKLGLVGDDELQFALSKQFSYPYLNKNQGEYSAELIAVYEPFAEQVEELRAIRSHLDLRWFKKGNQALSIVSANNGEGRSYLAANLAVVFSQLGEKTLLIDADFRSPSLHKTFNSENDSGLSIWLSGRVQSPSIKTVPHFLNLKLLPAGPKPPNPQELLSSPRFNRLFTDLKESFDIILVDTPASNQYTDAEIIASRVGGALLVSHKNKTRLKSTKETVEKINNSGAEIVGSVLNSY